MLDIAGGAHWANMSDFVITVHRDDLTDGDVMIGVRKVKRKEYGQRGRIRLRYRHHDRWFEQVAMDDGLPTASASPPPRRGDPPRERETLDWLLDDATATN